ncbi:putative nuclease HARBI1 [Prorops nasuta]|uniref:putative nuclease HARBI1 n=1 Tax=Prorops nasuta TaxID=863751 RepID=UPI0034CD6AF3
MDNVEEEILSWIFEDDNECNSHYISRRPRLIRDRMNWFNIYDDLDFNCRNNYIPPVIQLLATLRFFATGSYAVAIGDYIGISETSAVRTIHRVALSNAELHMEYIKFPSHRNHILRCQIENFKLSGFVRVIGAIDCFHVRIRSYAALSKASPNQTPLHYPDRDRAGPAFWGKYQYIEPVDDAESNVLEKTGLCGPGAQPTVHRVYLEPLEKDVGIIAWCKTANFLETGKVSFPLMFRIKTRFENGEFGNAILLGDSGYPNLPYLLTPLNNPRTRGEVLYNEAHIRTRCMVERCFGILGKKFPVLTMGSRFWKPSETLPVITACVILHNLERCSSETENCDIYNNAISNLEENLHEQERLYIIENYFERLL